MAARDDDLWQAYLRRVKPLGKAKPPAARPAAQKPEPGAKRLPLPPAPPKRPARQERHDAPLDRKIEQRLRQGKIEIEARIDLHGYTHDAARQAFEDFIARQARAGRRCLLVITGKGTGGKGVLRGSLAGWLAASHHARRILALRPAAPQHGGDGAFYILLRRPAPRDR